MASAAIGVSRFHGQVRECSCGLYQHPENERERACTFCLNRGFVAECTACDGKGQLIEKMAGGPGTMKATCNACGGIGTFPARKPEGWVDAPKEVPQPQEETSAAE